MMRSESTSERGGDLAGQLTKRVEELVRLLRDHSVRPILTVAGVLIVAIAGVVLALAVVAALAVAVLRLFNQDIFGGRVWATDFLFGGMLGLAGLFLLHKSVKVRKTDVSS
jgi:hypothetical protein